MGTMPVFAKPEDVSKLRGVLHFIETQKKASAYLVDSSGQNRLELPEPLFQVLAAAARELAAGRSVVIFHYDAEVTTQQAADLIQISRPYLVKLLEEGKIAYRKVGTHRRIRIVDVLKYKEIRDEKRRADLKELIRVSESMGLYDDETSPGESD